MPREVRAAEALSDGLAAVVNGKPITRSEVKAAVQTQAFLLEREYPAGGPEFERAVNDLETKALQDLIDRELILKDFEDKGGSIKKQYLEEDLERFIRDRFGADRKKFYSELEKTGMTIRKFREVREKIFVVQTMRSTQSRSVSPPTPDERDAFLSENKDLFREQSFIKLRTITIPKLTGEPGVTEKSQRKLAQEIRSRVASGADFASEAKTYSQDSAADKGGDRGWIDRKVLNRKLAQIAFSMKEGAISKVVDDRNAFYILWVEGKQPGKMKPRSEIENSLNRLVLQEKRQTAYEQWIGRLRSKANIKRY